MKGEFKKLNNLVARNIKLYFKDKMIFFMSLLTPIILVVLFLTFLRGIYEESMINCLPEGVEISDRILNAFTGGWLFSSIMATSCVTVAFCSNMMVVDKINKIDQDFKIAPVKRATVQTSYVISNFITTFIICFIVLLISMVYLAIVGWYLAFVDVLLLFVNMIISVLFGTLLASIINMFVSSQGAMSACCSLVSSMYGFICGAYMPVNSFGEGMRYFVGFLPGTYGTVLFRQYYMNGVLEELGKSGNIPAEAIEGIRKGFDGTFSFFGNDVPTWAMFLIMGCSVAFLFGIYLLCAGLKLKRKKKVVVTEKQEEIAK